ncbi:MAG: RNA polymerase sigma factor, partial [Chloroflexota bacterium]|nr:RNA polymerase sigma factor [Chloroflexota bacterium]
MVALPRDTARPDDMSTPTEPDDLTLARRVATDRAALGALYDRYVNRIYGFCLRRLGDRDAAEDATSRTFLKALAALQAKPVRSGSFKAWIFTIAYHVMIDDHRAARPTAPLMDASEVPESGSGPEDLAVAGESGRELHRLVALLSPDQRDVIHLRLADLTDREIGAVLGKRPGAIRTIQHRAVKRLRELTDERGLT